MSFNWTFILKNTVLQQWLNNVDQTSCTIDAIMDSNLHLVLFTQYTCILNTISIACICIREVVNSSEWWLLHTEWWLFPTSAKQCGQNIVYMYLLSVWWLYVHTQNDTHTHTHTPDIDFTLYGNTGKVMNWIIILTTSGWLIVSIACELNSLEGV